MPLIIVQKRGKTDKQNSLEEIETQDSKTFLKVLGSVVGALGGFAALFVAFGYITLQSFLSNMKLYGIASFPLQFYKQASVTFMRDIANFYSHNPILIFFPVLIFGITYLLLRRTESDDPSRDKKTSPIKFIAGILFIGLIILIILITLGILEVGSFQESVFAAITLPLLFSLFLYLIVNFKDFDFSEPLKRFYALFFIVFVLLFLSVPIGYGSYLYDITVFTCSIPECNQKLSAFGINSGKEYRLLYLMGHTNEREIFFDATTAPITVILINKDLIKAIKVNYSRIQNHSLRKLNNMTKKDFIIEDLDQRLGIEGQVKQLESSEINKWLESEVEEPEKMEIRND